MNQNVNPQKTSKKLHFELMPDTGTLSYDDTKKYFSRIGISIFAYFTLTLVIQAVLTVICLLAIPESIRTHSIWGTIISYALSFTVSYGIGIPIFLKFASPLPDIKLLRQKMKVSHVIAGLSISIFIMLAGNYVSQVVIRFLESLKGASISNPVEEMTAGTPWWLNLIFIAIAAPIFEELFFRKILCKHLLPLGEGWAIFLSAAIFGFAHGNFSQFFYAFALGAFFAFIYIKTGKLIYSVFYHMFINTLGGVVSAYLLERLNSIDPEFLESAATDAELLAQNPEAYADMILTSMLLLLYSAVLYGLAIAGAIIFFKAIKRKKLSADSGLLPPVKQGKVSALMLNIGVALSIAYFTLNFVISLI